MMARLDGHRDSVSEVAVIKPVSGSGSLHGEQRSASASWSLLRSLRWRMKYDENWHRYTSVQHYIDIKDSVSCFESGLSIVCNLSAMFELEIHS